MTISKKLIKSEYKRQRIYDLKHGPYTYIEAVFYDLEDFRKIFPHSNSSRCEELLDQYHIFFFFTKSINRK